MSAESDELLPQDLDKKLTEVSNLLTLLYPIKAAEIAAEIVEKMSLPSPRILEQLLKHRQAIEAKSEVQSVIVESHTSKKRKRTQADRIRDLEETIYSIGAKEFVRAADFEVDRWVLTAFIHIDDKVRTKDLPNFREFFHQIAASISAEVVFEGAERYGSWWQSTKIKFKELTSKREAKEALEKIVRGVEVQQLGKPQAEADHLHVTALAQFAESTKSYANIAMRVGSLLLLKTTRDGESNLMIRTLNHQEMMFMESHPGLTNPIQVEEALSSLAKVTLPPSSALS